MKPIHQMTKLERERAKLREIQQHLRGFNLQGFLGCLTGADAHEYSRLCMARDICQAAIIQYEKEEAEGRDNG